MHSEGIEHYAGSLGGLEGAEMFAYLEHAPEKESYNYSYSDTPAQAVTDQMEKATPENQVTPGSATAEPLRIRTLGTFIVERGTYVITSSMWRRACARTVFQYLLHHRHRRVPSEELAELLWPGNDPHLARQSLHQAIAALRHVLEPDLPPKMPSSYLHVANGTYQLILPPGSSVDSDLFIAQCVNAKDLQAIEEAVALYTGTYLEDNTYADWTIPRRELLFEYYQNLMLQLASHYFADGRLDEAIAIAESLWEEEPWSEDAALLLMRIYYSRNNRSAALRTYRRLLSRLSADLNMKPRADITEFHRKIVQG